MSQECDKPARGLVGASEADIIADSCIVPEAEYRADLENGLNEIAEGIARAGVSISALARGARVGWETAYHAANGIPVRYENARRIALFVEKVNSKLLP